MTLAKLNHPNIATLYSLFRQGEELYMVLEFVRGETLDAILQRRGALPAEEAIPVFCQVLDGIDHAHEFGIVHRDIKPANMMLTEKGTLKVLDFGIARLLGSARMTRAGNIIGTLEYMAPEQVKGQETDGRSDIYALGMMLYEVLTGQLPFDTDNEFELMKLQTEEMPPSRRDINPAIPEEVEAAIMRAIQKNPDHRFQFAGEFRTSLLHAGFDTQAVIRRPTGSDDSGIKQTNDSIPAINQSSGFQIPVTVKAIKETALSENAESTSRSLGQITNSESFLSKLNAVHYIGGVAGAAALIGLLVLASWLFSGTPSSNVSSNTKPNDLPKSELIIHGNYLELRVETFRKRKNRVA